MDRLHGLGNRDDSPFYRIATCHQGRRQIGFYSISNGEMYGPLRGPRFNVNGRATFEVSVYLRYCSLQLEAWTAQRANSITYNFVVRLRTIVGKGIARVRVITYTSSCGVLKCGWSIVKRANYCVGQRAMP